MRKILQTLLLIIILLSAYGCQDTNQVTIGIPSITNIVDIDYTIGDDIPNYLEGVVARNYAGETITTVLVDDSEVNYDSAGKYNVYYIVTDINGSKITATISIFVKEIEKEIDYGSPYFIGVKQITYNIGEDIPDYKADITAYDEVDGDLTHAIIYSDIEVNFEVVGEYTVEITVYDLTGNKKSETFIINVVSNEKPIISGYNRIYYYIGDLAPNYLKLINAYDNEDGNLTDTVIIDDSQVDLTTTGIYPLYYQVSDSFEQEIERVVSVQVMQNNNIHQTKNLNIYYINDTHGSILEDSDEMGLAKLGNVIINEYDQNPYETLFLSGGDILQGNILSNYFHGSSMIDMFNYMNLDVFTIGNHEFDWGLDVITEYFNPNTLKMQAEFPLLGANVFYKDTEIRPDFIDAYSIIKKGNLKIGVVGVIGRGLESSIEKSRVEDYEFGNPTYWTKYYTELLRTEFDVDVVIAIIHDSDESYNQAISSGSNDLKVNAIFNGHLHSNKLETKNGVPVMQSASNAKALGHMNFSVDVNQNISLISSKNLNINSEIKLRSSHAGLSALIDEYVMLIDKELNEVIIYSSARYGNTELTQFMAKIIRQAAQADVGVHNYRGTRETLSNNQAMTTGTTYEIFPFDNEIISAKILGKDLKSLLINSSLAYSLRPGLNISAIISTQYYWVATNKYVFGDEDAFSKYDELYKPGVVDRVAFEAELRRQALTSTQFVIE